ncbi:hypothetical protein ACHAXR_006751 [Thalassiosira sp. AJA248-18]
MPGGAASLLGNLYFTTWSTLFAVIGTLIWWVRDWRQSILDIIQEQQEEYELAKRTIRRREEKRLARLAREADKSVIKDTESNHEESKTEEDDDGALCEDDPVDDDITISITSEYKRSRLGTGTSSNTSSPERPVTGTSSDTTNPSYSGVLNSSRSLYASALSFFYTE